MPGMRPAIGHQVSFNTCGYTNNDEIVAAAVVVDEQRRRGGRRRRGRCVVSRTKQRNE